MKNARTAKRGPGISVFNGPFGLCHYINAMMKALK
jgi:hypothetical protein